MSFIDEFNRGFAEVAAAMGTAATIGGAPVTVISDQLGYSEVLQDGGIKTIQTVTLTVLRSTAQEPKPGAAVIFDGKRLAVLSCDADEVTYMVRCYDPRLAASAS
jgi:hypothetical protein